MSRIYPSRHGTYRPSRPAGKSTPARVAALIRMCGREDEAREYEDRAASSVRKSGAAGHYPRRVEA